MANGLTPQNSLEALNFVFSCSICHETLSQIHSSTYDIEGLRSGHNPNNGSIPRLWLTECAHLTCSKHLEGGGIPFHPEGQRPRAACPVCIDKRQDSSNKALYPIMGLWPGQYDEDIPKEYFILHPLQLNEPGNENIRFQYVSLLRFAAGIHRKLQVSESNLSLVVEKLQNAEADLKTCTDQKEATGNQANALTALREALYQAKVELQKQGQDISFIDTALSEPSGPRSLFARGSAADLEALRNESESQISIDRSKSANELRPELHYLSKQGAEMDGHTVHQPRLNSEALHAKGIPSREIMPPPTLGEDREKTQNRPSGSGMLIQQSPRKPSNRLTSSNLDTFSKRTGDHGESYQRTYDKSSQLLSQSVAADAVTAFHLPQRSRNNSDNSLQTLLAQYEHPNTPVSYGFPVDVADSTSTAKDQSFSNIHRTGTDTRNTNYDLQNQPPNSGHLWPSIHQEPRVAENRSLGLAYASHKYSSGNVDEQAQIRRRAPPVPTRLTFPPSTPSITLRGTPLASTAKRDSASRAHTILASRSSQRRQQQKALSSSTVRASPYFRSATLPSGSIPRHSKGLTGQTSLFNHKPSDHSRPTSVSPFPISSPSRHSLNMRGAYSTAAQPQQRTAVGPVRGHGMRAGHNRQEYNPPSINSFSFTASPRLYQSKTPIGGVRGLYPNSTPRRPANR